MNLLEFVKKQEVLENFMKMKIKPSMFQNENFPI